MDLSLAWPLLLPGCCHCRVCWQRRRLHNSAPLLHTPALPVPLQKPFRFRPPARVQVVGSFAVCATCAPGPTVDLALQLPPDSLDPKDQLNHRWHAKRALYLAHLAPILKRVPGITIVGWESFAADPRRPALVLTPDPRLTPGGFRVRLLPVPPEGAFPPQRLAPARNNLRTAAGTAAADGGKLALLPTPHYNASVLQVDPRPLTRVRSVWSCSSSRWWVSTEGWDE